MARIPQIGEFVTLVDVEIRIAKYLGTLRREENRRKGTEDKLIADVDPYENDIEAVATELAMHRICDVYPSRVFDIGVRSADLGTDDGDFVQWGLRFDVKWTVRNDGHLAVPEYVNVGHVDLYALFVGTLPNYRYCGVLPAEEALRSSRLYPLGAGCTPSYNAKQYELTEIETHIAPNEQRSGPPINAAATNGPPVG